MANPEQTVVVTGRVRASATMPRPGGSERCVLFTTWDASRPFPRTAGQALPFEVETKKGEVVSVDPNEASVALGVRARDDGSDGKPTREVAWIAPGDQVEIEGTMVTPEGGENPGSPRLLACRIAALAPRAMSIAPHRLPPRALTPGIPVEGTSPVAAAHPAIATLLSSAAARTRKKKLGPGP